MRLIANVDEQAAIAKFLDHLGLPSKKPQLTPARAPPQAAFECDDSAEDDGHLLEENEPTIQYD